jgi:hypothetical protein
MVLWRLVRDVYEELAETYSVLAHTSILLLFHESREAASSSKFLSRLARQITVSAVLAHP